MICVLLLFYKSAVSQFFVGSLKVPQMISKDKASFIELDIRGATDYSNFYHDASPAAMGVKPESHFIGADLQVSGYGKFQLSQTRVVFELMTQEGTILKSWIRNCGIADELYHPGACVTELVEKLLGNKSRGRAVCFSKAKSLRCFACHIRVNNVLFWLT